MVIRPAILFALAFVLALSLHGANAGEPVVFKVDSARVEAGSATESYIRVTAPPPGVAAFFVDVEYDVTALTVTGCTSSAASCNPAVPGVVRFAGVHQSGYKGEDVSIGKISFEAIGAPRTTYLTINESTLSAWDPDTNDLTGVQTERGTVAVVDSVVFGDLDCSGSLGISDVLADLRFVAAGNFDEKAGCTPPGNIVDGKPWGDYNGDGVIDELDALGILHTVSDAG